MMKRSETTSPMEVEEFGSSSRKGVGLIEVDRVSHSVSYAEAEAAEAPSPSHVATSDFEPVDSPSRSEVDPLCRGASPASLRVALQ